jgi:CheY-like chemotaxis protein/HPt (histidine-containing phosphotransfer) domain-containing protein
MSPLRVLVAEDNRVNQQVAVGLLQRHGHAVDVVGDGRAAVEAVRAGSYDVVLMDVHMPELDGLEAARAIRRLPGDKRAVPIIALSASALPEETQACLAAGMNAYLTKPIDPVALVQALAGEARPATGGDGPEPVGAIVDEAYVTALVDALGPAKIAAIVAGVTQDARPHRERLAQARARGDLGELRAAAHALRGIATNLGLTALAALTGAIEDASLAGESARVEALCGRLDACLTESLERLGARRL